MFARAQPYVGFADITNAPYQRAVPQTVSGAAGTVSDQENQLRLYRKQQQQQLQQRRQGPAAPGFAEHVGLDAETASDCSVDHGRASVETVSYGPGPTIDQETARLMQENLALRQAMEALKAQESAKARVSVQETAAVPELLDAVRTAETERSKMIDVSKHLSDKLATVEKARTADAARISQLSTAASEKDVWAQEAANLQAQMQAVAAALEKKKQDEYQNLTQMADEQDALRSLRTERDTLAQQLVASTTKCQAMERRLMVDQQQMAGLVARLQHAEAALRDLAEENKELRRDAKKGDTKKGGGRRKKVTRRGGSGSGSYGSSSG